MFDYVEYNEFQSKVPKYWKSVSDKCVAFGLEVPIEKKWNKSLRRVLIVVGHVASDDIANKQLLSANSKKVLVNCFDYAIRLAKPYGYKDDNTTAFAAINFNYFKNYHLSSADRTKSDADAANRVRAYIREHNPTHILCLGEEVAVALFGEDVNLIMNKKGWVHRIKCEGRTRTVVNSIDYSDAVISPKRSMSFDDDGGDNGEGALQAAYTLGYLCRNIRNLLLERNPHYIGHIKVKPVLVDTIEAFDEMMEELKKVKKIAFDTEASNLNKIANKLLILQFSTDTKKGYVLPYLHKDTPFNKKELLYIRKKLRKFFMQKKEMSLDSYLIMYNGKFDITMIKQGLGIPFIYWPVYDCMVGEHTHDETLRFMESQSNTPHGNMAQVCCTYGHAFYFEAGFSKKDRGNMDATDLYDRDFQKYCIDRSMYLVTESGKIPIMDYIGNVTKYGKVLSYNHATQEKEFKECINTSVHLTKEDMFEIEYEGGLVKLTAEHEVWSVTRQAYVRVKDLEEGEEMLLARD